MSHISDSYIICARCVGQISLNDITILIKLFVALTVTTVNINAII